MAEQDFLENEPDDILDTGFDFDESPEADELVAQNTKQSRVQRWVMPVINAVKTNRRYQIVMGLVVVGILAIVVVQVGRNPSAPTPVSTMTQSEAPTLDRSNISSNKAPKKKKKRIKYVDLYKQLENRQLSPILRELSYQNISYNINQNGKQYDLQVDQDQLDQAKQLLAIKEMPSGTVKGYAIFDEASNLGVTEFDKRIRLIRALSGEMEKSIMEFDVVDFASVEIVIPEVRLFAVTQPPVTASILIRRKNGTNITDETVFAIIQLVANSVESLSPENVSVVDTEGRVLSSGVIDRMNKVLADQAKKANVTTSIGNGKVIIPVIEDVVDWFQLKFNYETVLEKKAVNQLNGVLPVGSFKVAVTIDLNAVSRTGAPDIKQIVTSVVVDEQFNNVVLNEVTLSQIKQAIAGAVGYVEGRDFIHISRASFLPKMADLSGESFTEFDSVALPRYSATDQLAHLLRLWPIFLIGCVISTVFLIIGLGIRRIINKGRGMIQTVQADLNESNEDFDGSGELDALTDQDVLNHIRTHANFSNVIRLKALSTQEIESVVTRLKEMVNQ